MKAKRTATAADLEDGKLEKEPKKPPKVVSKEPVAKEGPLPLGGPAEAFSKTTKRPAKEKQLFFDLIAAGRYTRQEIMQKLLEANPEAPKDTYSSWLTAAKHPKHNPFKWRVVVGEDGIWRFE